MDLDLFGLKADEVHRSKIKSGSVEVSRIFDDENISVAQEVDFKAVSSI